MANMDVKIPRFYPDLINHIMSRGVAQTDVADVITGTNLIGVQNGTEAELFDLNPLNQVDFNTSADDDGHVLINIDTQNQSKRINFIAILNHNMVTAGAEFIAATSNTESHINNVDFASGHADIDGTEIVNADDIESSGTHAVTPGTNGSTIIRFAETSHQHIGIQFQGSDGTFTATDLKIGCIIVGEYFDMPFAPDLSLKRSIVYDSNKIQESLGGQKYSTMVNHGRKTFGAGNISPFSVTTVNHDLYGGRIIYDLNFSFLNSDKIMPEEYSNHEDGSGDDQVITDVWEVTNGNHLPFIFSVDNTSEGDEAESEHIFARFGQDSLDMTQVANGVYSLSMKIEEEF